MKPAERISHLGTETAFAVSAEAKAFAAAGNKVYPFHIGDLNMKTPWNIIEAAYKAMRDGKTGYAPNAGIPELREALANELNAHRGTHYAAKNIAVQPGGKPVIGKFLLTLMNPGDEVLYPNPGFPIYESQIEFHGGKAVPYGYLPGKTNFLFNFEALEKAVTPKTRLLILNDMHNPTGAECPPEDLEALAEFVLKHDLYVLCDEAYFDVRYSGASRSLTSLPGMEDRCVILYTFSKKYAMTGWRLGCAAGPEKVVGYIAGLNLNDESCTNQYVQIAGVEALTGDQSGAREIIRILKERRDAAADILDTIPGVSCYRPEATFYLFPDVTDLMAKKGLTDYEAFRKDVMAKTGVAFCTRGHFGRPLPGETRKYVRMAYSGIDAAQIREGLALLKKYAEG